MHSLILAWASWILTVMLPVQQCSFIYYGEPVEVSYSPGLLTNGPLVVSQIGIDQYLSELEAKDWNPVIEQLEAYKTKWQLNDWLYFKLASKTIDEIAAYATESEKRMIVHYLLVLSDFDTRLCFDKSTQEVFIYSYSAESIFEVPMVNDGERSYLNLSAALTPRKHQQRNLNMHPWQPNPAGQSFGFSLQTLPKLKNRLVERPFVFEFEGKTHTIKANNDLTVIEWMSDYPFFDEGLYMHVPLSEQNQHTLYRQIEEK